MASKVRHLYITHLTPSKIVEKKDVHDVGFAAVTSYYLNVPLHCTGTLKRPEAYRTDVLTVLNPSLRNHLITIKFYLLFFVH